MRFHAGSTVRASCRGSAMSLTWIKVLLGAGPRLASMGSRTRYRRSEPVKPRNPPRRRKIGPAPGAYEDLNEMGGASYGVDGPRDPDNTPDDWPDTVAETDRWLSDHGAGHDEQDRWNDGANDR